MTTAGAGDLTRGDDDSAVAAPIIAGWLHLAAAPTFAVMALSTVLLDGAPPSALCVAAGISGLNGMAPMYLLMALFHLTPWLKLISRRHP
jgi:hypothetical protein